MLPLKTLFLVVGLIASNAIHETKGITYQGNSYELNVALSEYALDVPLNQRAQFIQNAKDIFTQASRFLFEATDYRMYFGKVNILIPPSWRIEISNNSPTAAFSYATADIRVEATKTSEGAAIDILRAINPKPCGQPGDHIIMPPEFINNAAGWAEKYGDRVKTFIHEFARFRYGVFEEHGFETETEEFPYAFRNVRGDMQVTGCNNTEIIGKIYRTDNEAINCTLGTALCRFYPDLKSNQFSTTSLMFMHYINSTTKFCDSNNHDKSAPNRQNHFCRNRSVKTVIENSREVKLANPAAPAFNTTPEFNIYVPAAQVVYVVFDVSNHDTTSEVVFNTAKIKVLSMIDQLAALTSKVIMGIAKLGSALTEVQAPIQVQGNDLTLRNIVKNITRAGDKLDIEQGLLDIGKKMTPFTYLSGSIVLFFKFNSRTDYSGNVESEVLALLNSRNTRLLTFELLKAETDLKSLRRISQSTNGEYYSATSSSYGSQIDDAITSTVNMAKNEKFQSRRITLTIRSVNVNSTAPFRSWIRNDYYAAKMEANFFIPKNTIGCNGITVKSGVSSFVTRTQEFQSWNGAHDICTFTFDSDRSTNHSYEITSSSSLQIHVETAEIINVEGAPLYLGGGGIVANKPVEVEITTSGDNGRLNMGIQSSEDLSFLIYASVKKGASPVRLSLVTALVQGQTGARQEIVLEDKGQYPDILADDGVYSGFFKPYPINAPTSYTISARLQGFTRSNTLVRSLPINQTGYCIGSICGEGGFTSFYQRYIPYGATLQVLNAEVYKEKPERITDFTIANYSTYDDEVTLTWTAPAASYGTQDKVDVFKIAYGEDSVSVIDQVSGLIPQAASIVSGDVAPETPGYAYSVRVKLNRPPSSSSPPLYFTISSLKNGVESYPAPMVYLPGTPGTTLAPSTSTTQATTPSTVSPTITTPATQTSTSKLSTANPTTLDSGTTFSAVTEPAVSTVTGTSKNPNNASWCTASLTIVLTALALLSIISQATY